MGLDLHKIRTALGLTRSDLAKATGVSERMIEAIELEPSRRQDALLRLLDYYLPELRVARPTERS